MRQFRFALCGLVLFSLVRFAAAQSNCALPSNEDIETAIGDTLKRGDSPTRPDIDLAQVHYVCQSSGMFRDTYRGVSLLATYTCSGSALCRGGVGEPSQFDFQCNVAGDWSPVVLATADFSFIENPDANFSTPTDTKCGLCVNPELLTSSGIALQSDPLTHCVGKKRTILPSNITNTLHNTIALHCIFLST